MNTQVLEISAIEVSASITVILCAIIGIVIVSRWMRKNQSLALFGFPEVAYLIHLALFSFVQVLHETQVLSISAWIMLDWGSILRIHSVLMIVGYYYTVRKNKK